jgi:hypothetical protein
VRRRFAPAISGAALAGAPVTALFAALLLTGCPVQEKGEGCACTQEYRMNVCVTLNGSSSLPDSLLFLRERQDGARDSILSVSPANCFGELPATQRILMLRNSAVVDSTGWFTLDTVACCHGEDTTVNFVK